MNDAVAWEDPPPIKGHRSKHAGKWTRILEPLMEQPKRWARIETGHDEQMRLLASQLRRRVRETPPGFWQFASRKLTDDESAVWARYLGPDEL